MTDNKVFKAIDLLMEAFDKPKLSDSLITIMGQAPNDEVRNSFVKALTNALESGMAVGLQKMYDALDIIKKDPAKYAEKMAEAVKENKDGNKT